MLFKLSNVNKNLALTLGYLNPALNNSALDDTLRVSRARSARASHGKAIATGVIRFDNVDIYFIET